MKLSGKKLLVFGILIVFVLGLMIGCSNSSLKNLNDEEKTYQDISGNDFSKYYPTEDSKLANHIPGQVIVKPKNENELDELLAEYDAEILRTLEKFNHYLLDLKGDSSVAETVNELNEKKEVEFAQPNYVVKTAGEFDFEDLPKFYTGGQWGLGAIDAIGAWDETTGSSDTIIAVLDTGVDVDHPEFGDRVLIEDGINTLEGYPEDDLSDVQGHGTHVAGIAAAGGPGEGEVAGVSWNSLILPVKVLGDEGSGDMFSVSRGISYVTEYQANNPDKRIVINMSLGGRGYSPAYDEVVNAALNQGVVVVSSMGNDYKSVFASPANSQGVIAVGATNSRGEKATFSTEGEWISVAAPGADILSSVPDGNYANMGGTSMASPFVSGTVALLLDQYPDLSPADVKYHLEETAEDLGPEGFDVKFGHGEINAARAVKTEPGKSPLASVYFELVGEFAGESNFEIRLYQNDEFHSFVSTFEGTAHFHDLEAGSYEAEVIAPSGDKINTLSFELNEGEVKNIEVDKNL